MPAMVASTKGLATSCPAYVSDVHTYGGHCSFMQFLYYERL